MDINVTRRVNTNHCSVCRGTLVYLNNQHSGLQIFSCYFPDTKNSHLKIERMVRQRCGYVVIQDDRTSL
jgi:hypothetical protein